MKALQVEGTFYLRFPVARAVFCPNCPGFHYKPLLTPEDSSSSLLCFLGPPSHQRLQSTAATIIMPRKVVPQRAFWDHERNQTLGRISEPRKHSPQQPPATPHSCGEPIKPFLNERLLPNSERGPLCRRRSKDTSLFGQNAQCLCQDHVQLSGAQGSGRRDVRAHFPGAGTRHPRAFPGLDNTPAVQPGPCSRYSVC